MPNARRGREEYPMSLKIYLSEEGRKTAYREGKPSTAVVEFRVLPELIDRFYALGGTINAEGEPELDARSFNDHVFGVLGAQVRLDTPCGSPEEAIAELERLAVALRAKRQREVEAKQAQIAEAKKEADAWLQEWPIERLQELWCTTGSVDSAAPQTYGRDPRISDRLEAAVNACHRDVRIPPSLLLTQADIRECAGFQIYSRSYALKVEFAGVHYLTDRLFRENPDLRADVLAEAERKNRHLLARLRAWVAVHFSDDPTGLARFDEGLLGKDEIAKRLREDVFAPLDVFARFKRLTDDDVSCDDACHYPQVFFTSCQGVDQCSAEEWETYTMIRDALATAYPAVADMLYDEPPVDNDEYPLEPEFAVDVSFREHEAKCGECEAQVTRNSCMVVIKKLGFTLSREYSVAPKHG